MHEQPVCNFLSLNNLSCYLIMLFTGRLRKGQKFEEDAGERTTHSHRKSTGEKFIGVTKDFSFGPYGCDIDPSEREEELKTLLQDNSDPKVHQKMLPNKLTLDKEGNMSITLGCGTKVYLKTDEQGRIMVPEGHEGLSMINGKTLEQLVGSGKVVQNKKKKSNQAQSNRPPKRSTTLFPAESQPGEVVQAKEWTPPVDDGGGYVKLEDHGTYVKVKDRTKLFGGTSIQAKEWTPPLQKEPLTSSVTIMPTTTQSGVQSQLRTYINRKKAPKPVSVTPVPLRIEKKKETTQPEEVFLSDGSDDSIEVIKETDSKGSNGNGGPRIQSVIGSATLDTFKTKPLTKSVTMTPVLKSKPKTPPSGNRKPSQWTPIIAKTVSLDTSASTSSRVPSPGAPQVVITPARNVPVRRNLQQTNAYQPTTNQAFVPMNSVSMRPAQTQFVPMNQMMPVNNQFQPVAQVVGMNNQYIMTNTSFPQTTTSYLVNTAPAYQYVPIAPAPMQMALPVNALDIGLPAGLTGQIVLANGDNNQFSYAFKLDDGGLIFLSNEQVSKLRAANGGKLTTMVQLQTL